MEITIVQAVLIGLWTGVCLSGMLLGIYTNRCLIMATGVGLILGDLPTGLAMGAVGELAFMGFGVSQGGSVPPNPMGPGIIGSIMAITMKGAGVDVATDLALSFPFAVAFQFVITLVYTAMAGVSATATKALENKQFKKFRLCCNLTVWVFLVLGFVIGFAGAMSGESDQSDSNMAEYGAECSRSNASGNWICHDLKCNGKERTDPICTAWILCDRIL